MDKTRITNANKNNYMPAGLRGRAIKEINMELIGKQIAIETILGQPPELHYPSWYAAQIEKLPPAPPEYLAEQAGILVTDADTISRAKAIDICRAPHMRNADCSDFEMAIMMLPPAQPERIIHCKDCKHWIPYDWMFSEVWQSRNINDYPEDEIGCNYCDMAMKADDFCSRAERRTE